MNTAEAFCQLIITLAEVVQYLFVFVVHTLQRYLKIQMDFQNNVLFSSYV